MQAIELTSEATDKEIEGLQAQSGTELAQIRAHVVAGTVSEECELDQLRGEFSPG